MSRLLAGGMGGLVCLLSASPAHAECRINNDCIANLVCENSVCVTASTPPKPSTEQAPVDVPAPGPAPELRTKRHSQAMFVSGIVVTSLAPIGFIVTNLGLFCELSEDASSSKHCAGLIFGGLAATGVLLGVGIPLIVVGMGRDPVASARLTPWLTPRSAGIGLRFEM